MCTDLMAPAGSDAYRERVPSVPVMGDVTANGTVAVATCKMRQHLEVCLRWLSMKVAC